MAAIWIDTSVIGDIAGGDRDLEVVVKSLGSPLFMTPKVQEELLFGNPFKADAPPRTPAAAQLAKAVVSRMAIQVDTMGSEADRRALFENQFKFKKNRTAVRAIEESDAIVLSQVAASAKARGIAKPRLITTDKRLSNNADAKAWKVEISLPDPAAIGAARTARMTLASSIEALLDNVERQHDRLFGEHKAQSDLINANPSVTNVIGIAGFWTNRLFNTDVPPLDIWTPAFSSLARAQRLLREGDMPKAYSTALRARGELLKASAVYLRWKDGIEGAGVKMQVAIGVVAVALILAATGAYLATAAAAPAGAATSVQSLAQLVARGDALAVRVAVSSAPEASAALQAWEASLVEAEQGVELLLRL
jgi:hypothetical protein